MMRFTGGQDRIPSPSAPKFRSWPRSSCFTPPPFGVALEAKIAGIMNPLEKCLSVLRVLIKVGDPDAVGLAEAAIKEFIDAHPGNLAKVDALSVLEGEILDIDVRPEGRRDHFASALLDYIDQRLAEFRRNA
jgi:ribosomal protein S18 acetylase RimI-like enzyme